MIEYPDFCRLTSPLIFDSHSHYTDEKFDGIRDNLFKKLKENGLFAAICCGTDEKSSKEVISLCEKYDFLYAAVGIHPEDLINGTDISFIYELAKNKRCVAIGEIGLDYYWEKENAELQKELFIKQILLAKELNLPVIVHDRDAHEDTLNILSEYKPKGVVHCFSGSKESAKQIISLGMYIGVGGVATFKNSKKLPEVIEVIPDNRLLIETDCPYLAPEPLRGRLNHSGLIPYTAEKIGQIKGMDKESVLKLTLNNAKELFGI